MKIFHYIMLTAACYVLITLFHGIHSIAKTCQPTKRPSWLITPQIDETCYYGINSAQFNENQPDGVDQNKEDV